MFISSFSCATKTLSDAQCCTCHLFSTSSLRSNFTLTGRFVYIYKNKYDFTFLTDVVSISVELGRYEEPSDAVLKSYEHCSGVHQIVPFK